MTNSLGHYQSIVSKAIEQYEIPEDPKNLYDPIRYILTLGGKRLRPVLTLMGQELFDSDLSKSAQAALAIELFHNFTLIHDDIMDKAPLRRGRETVHIKWNENIGILSGDALLIEVYKQLSSYKGQVLEKIFPLFNQTAIEVCEGQQMDMDFEEKSAVDIPDYLKMIKLKTAVLVGCSLKSGAIIGGATEKDCNDLYEFGVNLGIAFQLQDDILDVYAKDGQFGKQVGGDIISNKKTYLLLKAFELADSKQKMTLVHLLSEEDPSLKVEGVMKLYSTLGIREKATKKMNAFHSLAIQNLDRININEEKKDPLRSLAAFLLEREH